MLDIDPATGALIDSNGNFVLGTSATDGKLDSTTASNGKILIKVAPVQASVAKVSSEISGKTLTITSTNQTKAANIGFTFTKATDLPDGQRVKAVMDSTSSVINIKLNANELFSSMSSLEIDTIGEILNISMGSAATAISKMLDRQVVISTPTVEVRQFHSLDYAALEPAMLVKINYIEGISGSNMGRVATMDLLTTTQAGTLFWQSCLVFAVAAMLENSNIDLNREYTLVMEAQRALQASSSALQIIDGIDQKAASQIAAL